MPCKCRRRFFLEYCIYDLTSFSDEGSITPFPSPNQAFIRDTYINHFLRFFSFEEKECLEFITLLSSFHIALNPLP
jgi:hypothetical protein